MDKKTETFVWAIGAQGYECDRLLGQRCSKCGKEDTLVVLPPPLRAIQPDATVIVCAPFFGGCNHGFELAESQGATSG